MGIGVMEHGQILDGFRILQPVMRIPGLCYRVPGARPLRPPPSQIVLELVIVLDHFPFKLLCPSPLRRLLVLDLLVGSGGRVLLVLLRKSHRLQADRRGYKAGRFTYCASEPRPGDE